LVDLAADSAHSSSAWPHFRATFAVEHAPRIIARAKKRLAKRSDITWLASNIPPAVRRLGACADLTVCMNVVTMPQERIRRQMWDGIARVNQEKRYALIVVPSIESDPDVNASPMHTARPKRLRSRPGGSIDGTTISA